MSDVAGVVSDADDYADDEKGGLLMNL